MIRTAVICLLLSACAACAARAQTPWYDLTVHNAAFDASGTNLISGDIHPANVLPTMDEFRAAQDSIAGAYAVSTNAHAIAVRARDSASNTWHEVADLTSNGIWEVAFTLSALRGVGGADDIASETVGFSVEQTLTNRLCHAVQWFAAVPPQMPAFSCTNTTNLTAGVLEITVTNSYPQTVGLPSDYGKAGGACYRITVGVPLEWGESFFKFAASGFILRGNYLPVVGGVTGGANYDVTVLDAATLEPVTLNIRGGFAVDTNNPLVLLMME
jgi:hypothetical protein